MVLSVSLRIIYLLIFHQICVLLRLLPEDNVQLANLVTYPTLAVRV